MANFALVSKYLEESLILFDSLENQTEVSSIRFLLDLSQTLQTTTVSQENPQLPPAIQDLQQQIAQKNLAAAFASLKKLEAAHFKTN
jgi:hypothetical protein